jgi:hypothetical protein
MSFMFPQKDGFNVVMFVFKNGLRFSA